jgi:hypothetical protein
MSLHYDEKGKFFTDYISKDAVKVILQTATNRIEGTLYIRTGDRVSDTLNHAEKFIALTDASVFDLAGKKIYEGDFLAVNVDLVIWLKPLEEPLPDHAEGDLS